MILLMVLFLATCIGGRMWWRSENFEETDNAYLAASISTIAPRIVGTVSKVWVRNNQQVQAGDVLLELDPTDQQVRRAQVEAQLNQLDAQLQQAAQIEQGHGMSASSSASRAVLQAQKAVVVEQLREAKLQLDYNKIVAPVSGRIGRRNVEVGERVQAGQQLFAIVQDGVWVRANFKETQLARLSAGQQVGIQIDALPGRKFSGRIESFSPASGAEFALLPADNATGNFTKIVQRVPATITFDADELKGVADHIAPGMSAVIEIDLRQEKPAPVAGRFVPAVE
ncbi:hypothetical protein ASE30_18465 [Achromobacter sp. Root83]|uniref:HlyD family secretion protein n=1 Tax=Achromobacter sp. Root83 TaxID=1736602 RepID=UPI00070EF807|nr:HlyD family secretion protein [Achromobacter sp. Root83]KRC69214.1 hypothetical protein ASE30_18465 [Achromobacter sp. Root83]